MPPRVLYRLVYHDPLTREDFLSDEESGAPAAPHETPEDRSGMSVWGKLREARGWAKWQVRTGKRSYVGIAEVIVEESGPFRARESPSEGALDSLGRSGCVSPGCSPRGTLPGVDLHSHEVRDLAR